MIVEIKIYQTNAKLHWTWSSSTVIQLETHYSVLKIDKSVPSFPKLKVNCEINFFHMKVAEVTFPTTESTSVKTDITSSSAADDSNPSLNAGFQLLDSSVE